MNTVSIIIPCYNARKWIGDAIDSALSQDYADLQVIVVDDGSTDDSRSLIETFAPHVTYLRQENRGPSAARNFGLQRVLGDFVQFLDADDVLNNSRIKIMLEIFKERPSANLVAGSFFTFSTVNSGSKEGMSVLGRPKPTVISDALCVNYLPWSALFRRRFLESVGPWNESLMLWEDLEFHARVAARSGGVPYVDIPLYGYRQHGDSRTSAYNRSNASLDAAFQALTHTALQLELANALTPSARAWLLPFYINLSRRYAKAGDEEKFLTLLHLAVAFSDRAFFKGKAFAAEAFARVFGVHAASNALERLLPPFPGEAEG